MFRMPAKVTEKEAEARRVNILQSARWCFLNFGYSKTSLDDIAKRANISRTLLYRTFKNKEDIFTAVFAHWLIARLPEAIAFSNSSGTEYQRLLEVCRVMVIEPWSDMVGAPMAAEFYDVCERIDPTISEEHREIFFQCVTKILKDEAAAEVLLLALDGLLADDPTTEILEQRTQILVARFASHNSQQNQQKSKEK